MPTLSSGDLHVFTFKEGLLSTVAHDLRLSLPRFEVQVEGEQVRARFFLESLRVDGPVREGRVEASGLGDKDRRDILGNVHDKILDTRRHPEVRFEGRFAGGRVSGQLELKGQRGPVDFALDRAGERLRGEVTLTPSRFGIAPFKALLGAIKLQDRVVIRVDLPAAPLYS